MEDNHRWQIIQVQYYIESILEQHEQDRKIFESRTDKYTSSIKSIRDIPLPIIGFLIALFFSLGSLKIFENYEIMFMILALIFSAIGVFLYVLLTNILEKITLNLGMVYASRLSSILRLTNLKHLIVDFTFDDEILKLFNFPMFLTYIRLVSAMKIDYLRQLESISSNRYFLLERPFYKGLIKREEGILYHFCNFFLENRDSLAQDEFVALCEKNLANFYGGQSIFGMYENLAFKFKETKFEDNDLGIKMEFPKSWIIDRVATEHGTKSLSIIVRASPRLVDNTKVIVSILKISTNNRNLQNLHEDFAKSDFESILESGNIEVNGISGHKLVYTTSFQRLVNKTLEIWLPIKNKISEVKFDASNELQYETFLPDFDKVLNSIELNI